MMNDFMTDDTYNVNDLFSLLQAKANTVCKYKSTLLFMLNKIWLNLFVGIIASLPLYINIEIVTLFSNFLIFTILLIVFIGVFREKSDTYLYEQLKKEVTQFNYTKLFEYIRYNYCMDRHSILYWINDVLGTSTIILITYRIYKSFDFFYINSIFAFFFFLFALTLVSYYSRTVKNIKRITFDIVKELDLEPIKFVNEVVNNSL